MSNVVVGILQARMGSSRLPGKVMMRAAGKTMFEHIVERMRSAKTLDQIVLATTDKDIDNPLVDLAQSINLPVYRGSEHDVLDRFYRAASEHKADVIVRLLNDCPLLDPSLVDEIVRYFLDHCEELDFISNQFPHTYPDGMDVSVFSFDALQKLHVISNKSSHREHVAPGFWENGNAFRWQNFYNKVNLFKEYRWTLDYLEDFELIKVILEELYSPCRVFAMRDILEYARRNPALSNLNKHRIPKNMKIIYEG